MLFYLSFVFDLSFSLKSMPLYDLDKLIKKFFDRVAKVDSRLAADMQLEAQQRSRRRNPFFPSAYYL